MFVFFAAAAVAWTLFALRWSISRQGRGKFPLLLTTAILAGASLASVVSDARSIDLACKARPSNLVIQVSREESWWRLQYARNATAFTTANELHVPAGTAIALEWRDLPPPWIDGALCLPQAKNRCTFVARSREPRARFVRLWHPMVRGLPIVVDSPDQFERWFNNEALPARPSPASWFCLAACGQDCSFLRPSRPSGTASRTSGRFISSSGLGWE